MTENFSTGDILQLHDTNCTKGAGTAISTVLGVLGVFIVLALLWNAYTNSRDLRANADAVTSGAIGSLTSSVNGTQEEVRALKSYERNDAIKLAFTDGSLYGRPFRGQGFIGHEYGYGYGPGFGYGYGYGHGHGHGHGCGHGCGDRHDDCHPHQQFREIRKFEETSDNIEVINTCGSLRG